VLADFRPRKSALNAAWRREIDVDIVGRLDRSGP
jgi:hypothetical protein